MDGPNAEGAISALRSREAGNQLVAASATEGLYRAGDGLGIVRVRRSGNGFTGGAALDVLEGLTRRRSVM